MNFSVEALQEMKNAALRQRMGGLVAGQEVQQSEEISSSQVDRSQPLFFFVPHSQAGSIGSQVALNTFSTISSFFHH